MSSPLPSLMTSCRKTARATGAEKRCENTIKYAHGKVQSGALPLYTVEFMPARRLRCYEERVRGT
ncbi:hypothetical protein C0Q70_14962 [Pomacea canaliculata]|uniref:Uncharacterized protein n=1 Tax=Pomacea canaliculata TaxID=400727 RepID=A0A2T7NTI0_POMCA|nr:hypothetical protein C0Q70_14962 [Pomacea canaliculata]